MLAKRAHLALLGIALVIELLFTLGGFFAPTATLGAFGVSVTPETRFLGHVVAWTLLFITLICGLALKLVLRNDAVGWTLSYVMGVWWIGIGLALCFGYGQLPNLFIDTLKGALLVLAAATHRRA